jgi:hypothetical protein
VELHPGKNRWEALTRHDAATFTREAIVWRFLHSLELHRPGQIKTQHAHLVVCCDHYELDTPDPKFQVNAG